MPSLPNLVTISRQNATLVVSVVSHSLLSYKHEVFSKLTSYGNNPAAEVPHPTHDLRQEVGLQSQTKSNRGKARLFIMASVFTFDPDPPRLSSPWPTQSISDSIHGSSGPALTAFAGGKPPVIANLSECDIARLQPEPQDGPIEYKLHLLLRPRRSFSASSTVQHVSGSQQSKSQELQVGLTPEPRQARLSPGPIPSSQSRQNRLQHLTTQLLWRLQQSSPYHSSSKADLVVPLLLQGDESLSRDGPDQLLPGLEESQGALYEIGVSDDGVFVGLIEDELEESLTTLRAMAFSLGCKVELLRVVLVGNCQWTEEPQQANAVELHTETQQVNSLEFHTESLWVAEALVNPNQGLREPRIITGSLDGGSSARSTDLLVAHGTAPEKSESQTEQLRISLTGSSTSGKSSLLGTLSTSTLDNGRGKSRLSLLKHRHEIVSGISSSVTPELIGYHDVSTSHESMGSSTNVINYASGNVSSWNDIHSASEPGRLVFLTDSAGHQRYCRTIVRGLVSWAPHWTICCIAADAEEGGTSTTVRTASSRKIQGSTNTSAELSRAHLILCLKLKLPLVVVITKLDVASRYGLRQTLTKLLSILKSAGRQPTILSTTTTDAHTQDAQHQVLRKDDGDAVLGIIASVKESEISLLVPIVLTSVVTGSGIGKLHALLRHLPLPRAVTNKIQSAACVESFEPAILFHIDEVFTLSDGPSQTGPTRINATQGMVLSGHLRYGTIMVGDELFIGPLASGAAVVGSERRELNRAKSFPGQDNESSSKLAVKYEGERPSSGDFGARGHKIESSSPTRPFWQKMHITSLRNLRLPVRKLLAGQVGTVGITTPERDHSLNLNCRIRKGMVLIKAASHFHDQPLSSYYGCAAVFDENHVQTIFPGSLVIVYIASIRASARIISVSTHGATSFDFPTVHDSSSDEDWGSGPTSLQAQEQEVKFEFVNSQEWIELGTPILVMPAGGLGISRSEGGDTGSIGLDGFVGRITQTLK